MIPWFFLGASVGVAGFSLFRAALAAGRKRGRVGRLASVILAAGVLALCLAAMFLLTDESSAEDSSHRNATALEFSVAGIAAPVVHNGFVRRRRSGR